MTMNVPHKLVLMLAAAAIVLPQPAIGKSLSKAWSGAWHLNTAQSHFSSPDATSKSDTRTYTVSGNRLTMRSTSTNAAGGTMKWSYSARTDGKWYPASGNPGLDHMRADLSQPAPVQVDRETEGKVSARSTATLSADGKTLTISRSILTVKGGPTDDTLVFDRVK
jgi:hypothetical protein